MGLFTTRAQKLEELKVGDVIWNRDSNKLNLILAVPQQGVYIISWDNDYRRSNNGASTAYELLVDEDCVLLEGDKLAKKEEELKVKKD